MSTLKDYADKALRVKLYENTQLTPKFANIVHLVLGLSGETGELSEKIKKAIRDKGCCILSKDYQLIEKEMCDIIFYWVALCDELEMDPDRILAISLEKIQDRLDREVLQGSGDER